MIQAEFIKKVKRIAEESADIIGAAVGGSWLTNEVDEYSDVDLILVTKEKISGNKAEMLGYAKRFGELLCGFTGEHVNEPRLLICLYDNPLLHVDIKFLTLEEVYPRVEDPVIIVDTDNQLKDRLSQTKAEYPSPDYQWIEDRFWIWVHYILLKIGRGEYMEAYDSFGFLRSVVFGPLLYVKNGKLPRGVRKAEFELDESYLNDLKSTLPSYNAESLFDTLSNSVAVYRKLRNVLFGKDVTLRISTEEKVMSYFRWLRKQLLQ